MAKKQTKMAKKPEKVSKNTTFMVFDKQIEGSPITKSSGRGWINWGKKNNAPAMILDMYNNSCTLDACINFCVSSLIGGGLILDGIQSSPCYKYSWDELIRRLATDFFLYGSFCLQIIKNKDGKTYSFFHTPLEKVRCGERDADGVINEYYLSADWSSPNKAGNEPIAVPSFIMRDDNEYNIKTGVPYIYVWESYSPTMDYYWTPTWWSAMKSVMSECEFQKYDLANSTNAFLPSGMLSMPPCDSDEEKNSLVEQIRETFIGSSNSARLMVSFRADSSDEPIHFEKFNANSGEFDLFESSNERVISRILASFNIPSRMLIGYPETGTGLNSEGKLLETAYNIYNVVAGYHYRNIILGTINNLFKMNGIDIQLEVREISFDTSTSTPVSEPTEQPSQDISEENINEEITN